jgi:hypothetical protein
VPGLGAPRLAALRRPCSIRVWPELPAPGELVRLPLPCPTQLVELSHYRGDRRCIALWSSPVGDELIVCDGALTTTAPSHGWSCFCAHPLAGVFLDPYQLGQTNDQGEHRLLVDRYLASLHVGLAEDVKQLLATQPSDLTARTDELSPGEMGFRPQVCEIQQLALVAVPLVAVRALALWSSPTDTPEVGAFAPPDLSAFVPRPGSL